MISLHGILAPVVTPFTPAGEIDADGFVSNLGAHLGAGLRGIVVAGSTGEAALLDEDERLRLVELARAEVPRDRTLIVGTGGESTRAVIARSRDAAERGADAVLVVAPHYYGAAVGDDALEEHYVRVADASPIPVLLYTIPKYMHFAIPADVVMRLARHENIVGMKDSSGDAALLAGYLAAKSPTFRVLTGSGTLYGEALRLGADGAILAVALFAPERSLAVLTAHEQSDAPAALAAQAQLTPLAAEIVARLGVAGVKCALDVVGLTGGTPRPPLRPLSGTSLDTVRHLASGLAPEPTAAR